MRIWVHQAWWEERDVTLELFILSTEILATFAAISIFSMVSWTECFEPSLVFCLISSLKENWVNRYYSLGRKHESSFSGKKNWIWIQLDFGVPVLQKDLTDPGHWTLLSVEKHWWNSGTWLFPYPWFFPIFSFTNPILWIPLPFFTWIRK